MPIWYCAGCGDKKNTWDDKAHERDGNKYCIFCIKKNPKQVTSDVKDGVSEFTSSNRKKGVGILKRCSYCEEMFEPSQLIQREVDYILCYDCDQVYQSDAEGESE